MKRFISIVLMFVMLVTFSACGSSKENANLIESDNKQLASEQKTPEAIDTNSSSKEAPVNADENVTSIQAIETINKNEKETENSSIKQATDTKQQAADTKPEEKINVEKKKFNPADLDGLSYSEIAEKIKTVEELDEWLIYRNYGATDPAHDWHFAYGGISDWSVNRPAEKVLDVNSGNCGGGSNLFCYMLNGDYDEIGYIWRRDSGGGHVMNYVLSNGVYTWYDVTALVTFEEDKPAEERHIRVFNKSTDLFATAKKYALSVDNGWKNHNSDMYIRSIYFIKCINGEPHTPIYSVPVQVGDVLAIISCNPSLVTEVYVREDDAQNNGAIVKDYNIPTSAYPKKMYQ